MIYKLTQGFTTVSPPGLSFVIALTVREADPIWKGFTHLLNELGIKVFVEQVLVFTKHTGYCKQLKLFYLGYCFLC